MVFRGKTARVIVRKSNDGKIINSTEYMLLFLPRAGILLLIIKTIPILNGGIVSLRERHTLISQKQRLLSGIRND